MLMRHLIESSGVEMKFSIIQNQNLIVIRFSSPAYCDFVGQRINAFKSEVFCSPNMKVEERDFISSVFGIRIVEKPGVYLGSSLDFTRKKGDLFGRILDRFSAWLASWRTPQLAFTSRLVLVKHTFSNVPIYLFSVFRAPTYFVDAIRKIIVGFFMGER